MVGSSHSLAERELVALPGMETINDHILHRAFNSSGWRQQARTLSLGVLNYKLPGLLLFVAPEVANGCQFSDAFFAKSVLGCVSLFFFFFARTVLVSFHLCCIVIL